MRIGCFGINANPPHFGHLAAAEALLWSGFVDQVWIIPVYNHPFGKEDVATWEHRINMCRLIENLDIDMRISLAEAEVRDSTEYKHEKSYTIYTLEYLRRTFPSFQFVWCVGSDIVTSGSYKKWHRWEDLEREKEILVIERPGYPLPSTMLPRPFVKAGHVAVDISSAEIRLSVKEELDVAKYTGVKIANYIKEHKLYL